MKRLGSIVTIGTFDGVHRGHQRILDKTCELAREKKCTPTAITFDIPPRHFFSPSSEPYLLTSLDEKKSLLERNGIKNVVTLRFNSSLSRIPAEAFFNRFILHQCGASGVIAGYNFRFGKDRQGDGQFLEKMTQKNSLSFEIVPPLKLMGLPVSSGRIREQLKSGNLDNVNRLLGHPYLVIGQVIRGERLGKKIGFPTANLSVIPDKMLMKGVFAVKATFLKGNPGAFSSGPCYHGMCNVGYRPTVARKECRSAIMLEVHLFRFSGSLYGRFLKVEFYKKIRNEKVFSRLDALKTRLHQDQKQVLSYFRKLGERAP